MQPGTFAKYRQNPEQFITEAARLINEQKATVIVEHLTYDTLAERHDTAIFTENQTKQDFAKAGEKLNKHIYDYVVTDSKVERAVRHRARHQHRGRRVRQAAPRASSSRLPSATTTPTGRSPSKKARSSTSTSSPRPRARCRSLQLRGIEEAKIKCARRFFEELNAKVSTDQVQYDVVDDYARLMSLVAGS